MKNKTRTGNCIKNEWTLKKEEISFTVKSLKFELIRIDTKFLLNRKFLKI